MLFGIPPRAVSRKRKGWLPWGVIPVLQSARVDGPKLEPLRRAKLSQGSSERSQHVGIQDRTPKFEANLPRLDSN